MFSFLKRLFHHDEGRQEHLAPEDYGRWLAQEELAREKACQDRIAAWTADWRDHLAVARENVEALGSAELVNPAIPEKHKAYMIGNRREYIRRASAFLDSLSVPHSIAGCRDLIAVVQERMPDLARGLARPAGILSEFFAVQVRDTQAALATIEEDIKTLSAEIDKQLPPALTELRQILDGRAKEHKRVAAINASLKSLEHQLVLTERKLALVRKNIAALEASEEHKNLQMLRTALIAVQDKLRAIKTDTIAALQQLNDAFARYAHAHPPAAKFLQTLNNSPFDVVEKHGTRLANIIEDIRCRLEANTLDLKDKKREKALAACAIVTLQWADNTKNALAAARNEEAKLIKRINDTGLVEKLALLRKEEAGVVEDIRRVTTGIQDENARLATTAHHDDDFIAAAARLGVTIIR